MIPPVYALLAAAPDVVAIVADRIGEHGTVFATELRPYITWQIVGGGAEVGLDKGRACHDRSMVQLDCYHANSGAVQALRQGGRTA